MDHLEHDLTATICFILALVQSLASSKIVKISDRLKNKRPYVSRFLHFAGKPEIIFGLWAGFFISLMMITSGFYESLKWLDDRQFEEVAFVFVIMILASTRPITDFSEHIISQVAKIIPVKKHFQIYMSILIIGPLLGSLITEPAAMTISALLLKRFIFDPLKGRSTAKLFYSTLAVLFVNVSVGGSLTHFAAPPVLMVARVWAWDSVHMFSFFGWKAILVVLINVCGLTFINRSELYKLSKQLRLIEPPKKIPPWITIIHISFIVLCVLGVHHPTFVIGLFLVFLGFLYITHEVQSEVKIEESLLVGFFLGGLVILTAKQGWWLKPLLSTAEHLKLYLGTLFLAPVTDNAAITALASQVKNLSDDSKYLIVAAAVVGGGMTIIANAPNPAGYNLLKEFCPGRNLAPLSLFLAALPPTCVAGLIFYLL